MEIVGIYTFNSGIVNYLARKLHEDTSAGRIHSGLEFGVLEDYERGEWSPYFFTGMYIEDSKAFFQELSKYVNKNNLNGVNTANTSEVLGRLRQTGGFEMRIQAGGEFIGDLIAITTDLEDWLSCVNKLSSAKSG